MKIAICIPFYKMMDTHAVQSLITMMADIHNRGDVYVPVVCQSMYITQARAFLVQTVLQHVPDADFVLCIDTDHVYDAKALYDLIGAMKEHSLDILSAAYVVRGGRGEWVHMKVNGDGKTPKRVPVGSVQGITEVDVMGFGFVVFRMALLRRLWDKHGLSLFAGGFQDGVVHVGDDVRFSELAKAAGEKIAFHAGVKVGHISTVVL